MNCPSCNANIDYRFATNCAYCDCEVEQANLLKVDSVADLQSESIERNVDWQERVLNIAYIFASSIVCMISGAVVVYFAAALAYLTVFSGGGGNPGEECARGTAIGFLSLVFGGYLGTVGGSVFAIKHSLCKK